MKAVLLPEFGAQLTVADLPEPELGTGEVVVEIAAARVLSYANEVFSGARGYVLNLPAVPGTGPIGRVHAVGPDATRLAVGDWVFCDSTVRSRDDAITPDIILQGLTARGEGGVRLQQHFRHGAYAEKMLVPTENAVPIGPIDPADAARWTCLGAFLVPYGGWLAADLKAGETVLVSGATGHFGSGGVAVALAMGAGCVVAPGRNEQMLAELVRRFGPRVRPVRLTGDEDTDRQAMQDAAPGPIDCVLDLMPPSADPAVVRATALTVREFGRIILMGGIQKDVPLPYSWLMRNSVTVRGQWMYPRTAVPRLIAMVRAGLLDLDAFEVTTFGLDDATAAVEHAAANGGAFRSTVICP